LNYEIYPLPMSRGEGSEGFMTYLMNYEKRVPVIGYCWFIKGPKKNIIVDTGCPIEIIRNHRPGSHNIMDFENALGKVGLTPEKVDIIIQTHLHYDHCGNAQKCENAKVIVQKKEVEFALAPHSLFARLYDRELFSKLKMDIVEGETVIDEGVHILFTPGHSPGGQSVAVRTAKGTAIITGFCCNRHAFELPSEMDGHEVDDLDQVKAMGPVRAPGIHIDVVQAFENVLRVKKLADIVIPIHDPMFEKVEKIPTHLTWH
jgi:N-acyl homoserine lactone hydrolase